VQTSRPSFVLCRRFHHAVELIGRRWTGAILRRLMSGPARFSELRTAIPDLSDRLLCERLRELESEGIVTRSVAAAAPGRVEYELTDKGHALEGAILAIDDWAQRWVPEQSARNDGAKPRTQKRGRATAQGGGRRKSSAKSRRS
jgi:DNA-binding HxlR family transcriptional regulator